MAQAFTTTYDKSFRWNVTEKRRPCKIDDAVYNQKPVSDVWIIDNDGKNLDKEAEFERKKKIVEKLYRNRLWSVYQVSYCKQQVAKESGEATTAPAVENEIIEYGRNLFGKRTQKILQPVPSGRKIYGYVRPSRMYIPFTEYQNSISRMGYYVLDKNCSDQHEDL